MPPVSRVFCLVLTLCGPGHPVPWLSTHFAELALMGCTIVFFGGGRPEGGLGGNMNEFSLEAFSNHHGRVGGSILGFARDMAERVLESGSL